MNRRTFALATLAAPLAAHHSINDFNWRKWETYTGEVTALEWTSPHCYVRVRVAGEDLRFELDREYSMERKGVQREMLAPGRRVSIRAYVHLTDSREKRAAVLDLAEGTFRLMSLPEEDLFVGEWRLEPARAGETATARQIRIWRVGAKVSIAYDREAATTPDVQRPGSHVLIVAGVRHVLSEDHQTLTLERTMYRRHAGT